MAAEPIQIHIPPELAAFAHPCKELLKDRAAEGAAVGGFIFATPPDGSTHMLLVQREKNDGRLAGKWEVPGGGCEETDPTVLHSVAREVFEEVGLHMTRAIRRVGDDQYFNTRSGMRVVKFSFEIAVQEVGPRADPAAVAIELSNEHQDHAWATLADIEADKYPITHPEQRTSILAAFSLKQAERKAG